MIREYLDMVGGGLLLDVCRDLHRTSNTSKRKRINIQKSFRWIENFNGLRLKWLAVLRK